MSVSTPTKGSTLAPEILQLQDASVSLHNSLEELFTLLRELRHRPNGGAQRARIRVRNYIVGKGRPIRSG